MEQTQQKKSFWIVFFGSTMWGILPLYWALLKDIDPIFTLSVRLIMSAALTLLLLATQKKMPQLKAALRDKKTMRQLAFASLFITGNWALFIWVVNNGNIMSASLGYYMSPLMIFLCGIIIFKEKSTKLDVIALLLAFFGVLLSVLQFGEFPYIALLLAFGFCAYSVLKKSVQIDSIVSVCIETLLVTPLAIAYILFAPTSGQSVAALTPLHIVLLAGSGLVTALPVICFSQGARHLPMLTLAFLQYINPTLQLLVSIMNGEPFGAAQAVSFGCIWAGLALYSFGMVRRERLSKRLAAEQTLAAGMPQEM